MTEADIALIAKALAPVVRDIVIQAKADLRDRVLALETRVAMPPPSDQAVTDLRDRVMALETRSSLPPPVDVPAMFADLSRRLDLVSAAASTIETTVQTAISGLRERVAVVETIEPIAGPPGPPGPPGRDGQDGTNGTAGLTFRGVFAEGKTYDLGDLVTWAGSSWHCNETTTTRPGDAVKSWTLMVKRGNHGRDGAAGPPGPPGRDLTTKEHAPTHATNGGGGSWRS
jgi:hypothetical protein